jgi:hypothetical protein
MSRQGAALVWLVGLLLASAVLATVVLPRWTSFRTQDLVGTWQDASGHQLPDGTRGPDFPLVVHTIRGSGHCDWQDVIFLHLTWPVGTVHSGPVTDEIRQYVRDPNGKLASQVLDPYEGNGSLPATAVPTGFTRFGNKLFVDPDGAAYIRRPSGTVERWGRSFSLIACG